MGLFDKFKNIFTEEIEEDEVKKEVRQVEIVAPKELEETKEVVVEQEKPEEKFVFPVYFDDKDFEELAPKKEVEVKKELPKKEIYGGAKPKEVKVEKKFKPSPVISPVYGILDKNYSKNDIVDKNSTSRSEYRKSHQNVTLEDVRRRAFGTLEDELENSLFNDDPIYMEKEIEEKDEPDLFEEINVNVSIKTVEDKIIDDYKNVDNIEDDFEDNMTLEVLNSLPSEEDDLKITESDLFSLIDSMYEKDDQNGNV